MPTPPPDKVTLNPEALRVLREKDGHSLTSLAKLTGYSLGYINQLEKGDRAGNSGVIKRLALALNVPVSMLETRRASVEDVA
ncbi:MAG: family transcriptional regulator [Thermoleophilia bacterium]|nr:family transcriptional regulator [Thermoleophilia bacterium]